MSTNNREEEKRRDFVKAFLDMINKADDAAYDRAHRKQVHFFDDKDLASATALTVRTREER